MAEKTLFALDDNVTNSPTSEEMHALSDQNTFKLARCTNVYITNLEVKKVRDMKK